MIGTGDFSDEGLLKCLGERWRAPGKRYKGLPNRSKGIGNKLPDGAF